MPLNMKRLLLVALISFGFVVIRAQKTEIQYLSGRDKDHTVQWDFFCTNGMNSGKWSKIGVPSNWELQGFGSYLYGKINLAVNEKGLYKYEFSIPLKWTRKEYTLSSKDQ